MNCNQAQELLPLFAGRDLEEKQATLVADHVESCEACANSAKEYRQAQQMVRLFAPPPFSQEDYAGMRRGVLREIEQGRTAVIVPTLPQLLGNMFRPRIRWAIATALVLAVSAFAFYFMANKKNDGQQIVINGGDAYPGPVVVPLNPPAGDQPVPLSVPPDSPQPVKVLKAGGGTRSMNKRVMTSLRTPRVAQPDRFSGDVPAFSEKTTRVEIQTKDPNIRIIWFSPRPTKRDAPNKSSKHNQEARSNA